MADVLDVDAASRHVGGHQHLDLALAELLEGLDALVLGHVAGEHGGVDAGLLEQVVELAHQVAAVAEDHHAIEALLLEQVDQQALLVLVADQVDPLVDVGGVVDGDRDLRVGRLMGPLAGQVEDVLAEGRREQEGLALLGVRRVADDALDVGNEAHRQHAVGLVEHQHFHLGEVDVALLVEVQQAARGGDEDVELVAQRLALLLVVHAAHHARHLEVGEARQRLGVLLDLQRQLAGRGHDQRPRRTRLLGVGRLLLEEVGEDRDQEGRGLAGAGLGLAHHVAAEQGLGQRLGLDRRAVLVPQGVDRPHQRQRQIEVVEAPLARDGGNLELAQIPVRLTPPRLAPTTLGLAVLGRCWGLFRLAHRLCCLVRMGGWGA